jgi:hypothetical protein
VADEPQVEGAQAPPEASVPSHARPRRSAWWIVVTVVVAVLALAAAAAAGVAYGRASAPGPDIVVQPEPVVEESSGADPMPVGGLTPSTGPGAAPTLAPTSPGTVASAWPVVLTAAPGLPDTTGVATGYRLVNAGISGAQVASVLASTFGATGEPVAKDGTWRVGVASGPSLTVVDDPLFSWTFEDPAGLAAPAPGQQIAPARAIELAGVLLGSIGVDTGAVDWQVDRYFDRTTVTAWQLVAGDRTQLAWRVSFDPSGEVVQASGFSAGLEAVPGYPVVGAATAIARVQAAPWAALGPSPVDGPDGESVPSPTPSPSATPARPALTVPLSDVTVTGAELGLAQYWQPDGSVLMLPSYTLTGEDGSRWSVLAVDDGSVQFVAQPYPSADPATS